MNLKRSTCLFFLFIPSFLFAQSEEIRNKQRAIFIYNVTQQITYSNAIQFNEYVIGVLGKDDVMSSLQQMKAEGRTVNGKPLKLVQVQTIEAIDDIQLIYVNKNLNFDMIQILRQVRGKNILVVSEGYGFNESMINMINIGNAFQFDINQTILNREKFNVSSSLKRLAISSAERWRDLYTKSSLSLNEEREKVAHQQSVIIDQQTQIDEQINQIDIRNRMVEQLKVKIDGQSHEYKSLIEQNDKQQLLYDEKILIQKKLELQFNLRNKEIDQRKIEIKELDVKLEQQTSMLSNQTSEIEKQRSILARQRAELNYQRNFTILFIVLSLLAFTVVFFIWRSYRIKKNLNKVLASTNKTIEAKSTELERKNTDIEQFAYVASHDLQEPLNSIAGLVSIVNTDKLDPTGHKSMQLITDATVRMKKLIAGLLEHSRLGQQVQFSKVDCNIVMEHVKENLSKVIDDTGTTIQVGKLPIVNGHEVQLTLLFQNLISNAVKFTLPDSKPLVAISAMQIEHETGDLFWKYEVKDNGIGIAKENLKKIFTIFQRLHGEAKYAGTGIGLAHCKKIVDLHGGSIWVESEMGNGSSFFFTIPVANY